MTVSMLASNAPVKIINYQVNDTGSRQDPIVALGTAASRRVEPLWALEHIETHTREGSMYYTDDWQAWVSPRLQGCHVPVCKENGLPPGRNQINSIEAFRNSARTEFS
jgi:hypothetical protein